MNLHVIIGSDDYIVCETAKKIIGSGDGLELIDSLTSTNADAQIADLARVSESVATPPFLEPRKVTWWKNVHFLPAGGKKGASEEVKEALERFAVKLVEAKLPENQHFILSCPALLQTSIFAKTLKGSAEMIVFSDGKPYEKVRAAAVRVKELAAEMNLTFRGMAMDHFIAKVGTDMRSLISELNKMRDYLGPSRNEVTDADIGEVSSVGYGVEPAVWSVTEAIGERNIEKALAAAKPFERERGFDVLMSTVIEKFFRQLIDVQNGNTAGMNSYAISKNKAYLRNWHIKELRVARARFLMLREKVVSGMTCGDDLVVTEIIRACRKAVKR